MSSLDLGWRIEQPSRLGCTFRNRQLTDEKSKLESSLQIKQRAALRALEDQKAKLDRKYGNVLDAAKGAHRKEIEELSAKVVQQDQPSIGSHAIAVLSGKCKVRFSEILRVNAKSGEKRISRKIKGFREMTDFALSPQ